MSSNRSTRSKTLARAITSTALAVLFAGASLGAASAGVRVGWVWANQPGATSTYTPDTNYSYNSTGGAITIDRISAGYYAVTFAGLGTSLIDTVQATAYGGGNGYCQVSGWSNSPGGAVLNYIRCFDNQGVAADTYFTTLYQAHSGTFGNSIRGAAYLLADQPTAIGSYTPNPSYNYNSTGATNTVERTGVGRYTATIPGLTKVGGAVQVSAFGSTARRCKASDWGSTAAGTTVNVLCFDGAGAPLDSEFNLLYARKLPLAFQSLTATTGIYAYASQPSSPSYTTSGPYSFNSAGGPVTAGRIAKGLYQVSATTGDYTTSNVVLSAYGDNSNYCTIGSWFSISVYCFAQGGAPAATKFGVGYQTH